MPESFHARLPTPFAVLGIRTAGEMLTGIEYLPRGVATLAPTNKLAAKSSAISTTPSFGLICRSNSSAPHFSSACGR
jgi:hypothetical protein